MRFYIVFTLFSIFFYNNLAGQARQEIVIKDYTKVKSDLDKLNIIKTNPLSFFTGVQYIEYERYLKNKFSILGGVGVTFQPFLPERSAATTHIEEEKNKFSQRLSLSSILDANDFSVRNFSLGHYVTVSLRGYLGNEILEGFFVGIRAASMAFHNDVQTVTSFRNGHIDRNDQELLKEKYAFNDINLDIGYQYSFGTVTLEGFLGTGARVIKADVHNINIIGNSNIQNFLKRESVTRLMVNYGFRIGIRF